MTPSAKDALLRFGPLVATALLIPALSLLPAYCFKGVAAPLPPIPGFDKLVHALMYAGLAAAWLHAVPLPRRAHADAAVKVALAASLYGVLMELCQRLLTTTRSMDPLDALANAAGASLCALLGWAWARRRARRGAA